MSRSRDNGTSSRSAAELREEARNARIAAQAEREPFHRRLASKLEEAKDRIPDSWSGREGESGWGTKVDRD